jgi:NADP-dependent 3-hydroxy acid dehydrogenase YdfG
MADQTVVLITGASSGVGQSTARLLAQKNYRVFGTSRNPAQAEGIPGVEMLPLDVRADDSVRACVAAVSSRGGRLDVLINNAGHELAGALEELSADEARAQFETNFFGVVRMVNAVLPMMRRQKRGHIIMSVRSRACRRFRSWASIPPASLPWRATRKPYDMRSNHSIFTCR